MHAGTHVLPATAAQARPSAISLCETVLPLTERARAEVAEGPIG